MQPSAMPNEFFQKYLNESEKFRQKFVSSRTEKMNGEMAEWSKARAWKVRVLQKGTKGSNPFLSAK